MENNFKITEAFGPVDEVQRLLSEAVGIAAYTGSVGATCSSESWNSETGETTVTAKVTVARIREGALVL